MTDTTPNSELPPPQPPFAPPTRNWRVFWGVMLAPAVLSFLLILAVKDGIFLALFVSIFGSLGSGIFCGIVDARERPERGALFPLLVLLYIGAYSVMSFGFCALGCGAGGALTK